LQHWQRQLAMLPRQQRLQQVLAQLDFDLRNHRYITPTDSNLLMDFELLHQLDPRHPRLHKTFWELVWFFDDSTREALDTDDRNRASELLRLAIEIAPDMQRWQLLRQELQALNRHHPPPSLSPAPASWNNPDHWRERPPGYAMPVYSMEAPARDDACFGGDACDALIEELYDDRY
jgi:hypothetical protein